jgi:hypothetical protein
MAADVYVASESFLTQLAGRVVFVTAGETTARAGHPLLLAHPAAFRLLLPDFDVAAGPVPETTAEPASPRAGM